jgi:hypothetical protein
MRECRTYGSVRGVPGDQHPYHDSLDRDLSPSLITSMLAHSVGFDSCMLEAHWVRLGRMSSSAICGKPICSSNEARSWRRIRSLGVASIRAEMAVKASYHSPASA